MTGFFFFSFFVGSSIDFNITNMHILHVQESSTFNPYFALNNQSGMLYNKISINLTEVRIQATD